MINLRSKGFSANLPIQSISAKIRKRLGHMAVSGWLGSADWACHVGVRVVCFEPLDLDLRDGIEPYRFT